MHVAMPEQVNGHDATVAPRTPADFPPPRYRGGASIELADGETWRFAPFTLDLIDEGGPMAAVFGEIATAALRLARMAEAGEGEDAAALGGVMLSCGRAILTLAHGSLSRNYAGITRSEVGALLDPPSTIRVVTELFPLNGMRGRFRDLLANLGLSPPSTPTA